MTSSRSVLAAVVATVVVFAVLINGVADKVHRQGEARHAAGPTRVFGSTAQPAARPARASSATAADVARRWARAWGRATTCSSPGESLQTVLRLSGGELKGALTLQPPRPAGAAAAGPCRPPKLLRVSVHRAAGEGWVALAQRRGDGLRPLRLHLTATAAGIRVTSLDY